MVCGLNEGYWFLQTKPRKKRSRLSKYTNKGSVFHFSLEESEVFKSSAKSKLPLRDQQVWVI